MPKIFEWKGFKFFFFSNEGIPIEPCHIHIRKNEKVAKFWLDPIVGLASSWGMSSHELAVLEKVIEGNEDLIRRKWDEYFNS
jgi:hypothetical protein